jgi:hypothetical protein
MARQNNASVHRAVAVWEGRNSLDTATRMVEVIQSNIEPGGKRQWSEEEEALQSEVGLQRGNEGC